MLKLKDLIENFDLAKAVLSNWQYDEDSIDACFKYFRISSNAVYPFKQNGKLCFLRFAPTSEKLLTNIKGELEFIQYLRANGYPAAEPIKSKDGDYIQTVKTAWGNYYATAFYGVAGESIEESDFSDNICFTYGKALGQLHRLSRDYLPTIKKQTYEDILAVIEKRLEQFHCDRRLYAVLLELRKTLSASPKDNNYYGLIHYDFECDNVFYDKFSNSCNVIDFDDGIYHFYALDIEQAVDSIRKEAPKERHIEAIDAFMAGYKTEFLFDKTVEDALPTMHKFCALYSYTKLLYCLSEAVVNKPEWMTELENKLTRKAEFLKKELCCE